MVKCQILFVILLQVLNLSSTWSACIPIDDCPVALKYIQKRRNDPNTRTILLNAHCGLVTIGGRRVGKVFCDRIPDFEEIKQDGKNKVDLLPKENECGVQTPVSKITMGERTDFEDFPWIALFQYKNRTNHVAYRCHGTLISDRYVVTAAHCLSYNSATRGKLGSLYTIILGEYDTSTTRDCLPPQYGGYCTEPLQIFSPESTHVHPNFGTDNAVSDIGLVRLNKKAIYSDFVKPICLPLDRITLRYHEPLWVSGWGVTENRTSSTIKLRAKISYLTNTECSMFSIDSTQMCAGSTTGADTCKGDSGGPLMLTKFTPDRDIKNILVGIVSFGSKCGSGSAIYTNVATFIKWILDTIHE